MDLSRTAVYRYRSTDPSSIDRHAFERFLIADCAQSATCNVYALEHNSGVPGVLGTNPARKDKLAAVKHDVCAGLQIWKKW